MIAPTASTPSGKTASSGWKTASGFPGSNPNKRTYRIAPEVLILFREIRPAATTTASGVSGYGFRYYAPETGRWLGRDPIGERGGANVYAKTRNKSQNTYDLLGLREPDEIEERILNTAASGILGGEIHYELELDATLSWISAVQQIQALQEGHYTLELKESLELLTIATQPKGMAEDYLHGGLQGPTIEFADLFAGLFTSALKGSLNTTLRATARNQATRMAVVTRLGQRGEAAVSKALLGLPRLPPKTGIKLPGMSTRRFPDYLSSTMLVEVKNTKNLYLTQQIRDFLVCSQQLNVKFRIYYRPGANISGSFDDLPIELIPIPPAAPIIP